MAIRPFELKSILPDELNAPEFQVVRHVHRKQDARAGHFIAA
jgi:hypothetical protein